MQYQNVGETPRPRFQLVVIDQPIHVYDEVALDLWRKALWAKAQGYRRHYSSSSLPLGADDFFAKHLIVAAVYNDGSLEPAAMYKSVWRSQCAKFGVTFPLLDFVKGTEQEEGRELTAILKDSRDISYDSSWSVDEKYKEHSKFLRDMMTVFACNLYQQPERCRWVTAGVLKYKIDQYFNWLGGQALSPAIQLDLIDGDSTSLFYFEYGDRPPAEAQHVADRYARYWEERLEFKPVQEHLVKDR